MNLVCTKCFSSNTVPMRGSSTTFPSSLNQTLFSPSVLASIGSSICKHYKINPAIGVMAGVLLGGVISLIQEHRQIKQIGNKSTLHYCCQCHHVFEKVEQVFDGDDLAFE